MLNKHMEILPRGGSQSKQNKRRKYHGIMEVVVFIIKQPSSEYITAATENLSDVTQVEMFTDKLLI